MREDNQPNPPIYLEMNDLKHLLFSCFSSKALSNSVIIIWDQISKARNRQSLQRVRILARLGFRNRKNQTFAILRNWSNVIQKTQHREGSDKYNNISWEEQGRSQIEKIRLKGNRARNEHDQIEDQMIHTFTH